MLTTKTQPKMQFTKVIVQQRARQKYILTNKKITVESLSTEKCTNILVSPSGKAYKGVLSG